MQINGYSKIYTVGHGRIGDLFDGEVTVEEKIDGSQFSFGMIDGKMCFRSRRVDLAERPDGMFAKAMETAIKRQGLLKEGYIYRGEYLREPKQNTLAYDRVPKDHIIIFDIDTNGQTSYLNRHEKHEEARRIGLEYVTCLYIGKVKNFDAMLKLMERESLLGGAKMEGIVIKNYNKWTDDGKTMMGKYVHEEFKERNMKNQKNENPNRKDTLELLCQEYRNENRWEKSVQHLKEDGKLAGEPQDIGGLIKEVQKDIKEECEDEIKDKLFTWAWKTISRRVTAGLAEWYKEKIAKDSFENKEAENGKSNTETE